MSTTKHEPRIAMTVALPVELHNRVMAAAAASEYNKRDWVARALERAVDAAEKAAAKREASEGGK